MFRRETLIALRARRSGYRIAIDFLYPHLKLVERPIVTDAPPDEEPVQTRREREVVKEDQAILLILGAILGLLGLIAALIILLPGL